jgi:integrase
MTEVSREPKEVSCRSCRAQLGIDEADNANLRLEALFVLSITLGLRPGELRQLTWDHVDLNRGVVHVWRARPAKPAPPRPRNRSARSSSRSALSQLSRRTS